MHLSVKEMLMPELNQDTCKEKLVLGRFAMMLNQILVSEAAGNTVGLSVVFTWVTVDFFHHPFLPARLGRVRMLVLSSLPSEFVSLNGAKALRWERSLFTIRFRIRWRYWLVPLIKGASFPGEDAKVKTYGNKWELNADISLGIWPLASLWLLRSARIKLWSKYFAFWLVNSLWSLSCLSLCQAEDHTLG